MDSARLAEALAYLIGDEDENEVQDRLVQLRDSLNNLVANPSEPNLQRAYSDKFNELRKALRDLIATYNPAQRDLIYSLGAKPFFSPQLTTKIGQSVSSNSISPSVTVDLVNELISQRAEFISNVRSVLAGLQKFKLDSTELSEGESDVGFELPRSLFDNKFSLLIGELRAIQRVLRVLSEAKTGSVSEIEVHDISTSDPIFFLGLDPLTLGMVGAAVAWALSQWKKVEEIRKVRTETKKLKSYSSAEISEFFDEKIETIVHAAVVEEAKLLLSESPLPEPRRNELRSEL